MRLKAVRIPLVALMATVAVLSSTRNGAADDWEDLAKDGYGVAVTTQVNGEFEGCDFGKRIPLMNGMVFVCQTYNYSYSYSPDVYILRNVRGIPGYKVVIDDEEYGGSIYRRP